MDDRARAAAGLPSDRCDTNTQWIVNFANYVWSAARIPAVTEALVLDVGCGPGYGTAYLAEQARAAVGVDLLEAVARQASTRYRRSNLRFLAMRAERLAFAPRSFDAAVSHEALMHIDDHEAYLAEIRRVLKDDGVAIVSVPWNAAHSERPRRADYRREYSWESFEALVRRHFPAVALHHRALGEHLRRAERTLADVRGVDRLGLRRLVPRRLRHVVASLVLRTRGLRPLPELSVDDVRYAEGRGVGLSMIAVCRGTPS